MAARSAAKKNLGVYVCAAAPSIQVNFLLYTKKNNGVPGKNRTSDLLVDVKLLYRLSYRAPIENAPAITFTSNIQTIIVKRILNIIVYFYGGAARAAKKKLGVYICAAAPSIQVRSLYSFHNT